MITEFYQSDEALIKKLEGLIIDGKEVPVIYISPEREFKVAEYPSIAVYRAGIYPDNSRWTNDKFYDNYEVGGEVIKLNVRDAPIPYNVYYGVRLIYQYEMDGARLSSHINNVLRRGAYLDIEGEYYDIVYVSYRNPSVTYKEFGEQKENEKREYVEQYLYKVELELDVTTRTETKLSEELVITVDTIKE